MERRFRLIADGKKIGIFTERERANYRHLEHLRGIQIEEMEPSLSLSKAA